MKCSNLQVQGKHMRGSKVSKHGHCATNFRWKTHKPYMIWNLIYLSNPLVGSSRNSNRGLMRISSAMLTRRFSPPLRPRKCQLPTGVSAQSCNPISKIALSIMVSFSSLNIAVGNRRYAEYVMVSLTVSVPVNVSSCVTYAWSPITPPKC